MQDLLNDNRTALAKAIAKQCRTVDDIKNMIKELFKDIVQIALEAEMDEHPGYEKNSV